MDNIQELKKQIEILKLKLEIKKLEKELSESWRVYPIQPYYVQPYIEPTPRPCEIWCDSASSAI